MCRALRIAGFLFALYGCSILTATAQTFPLVFTPAAADRASPQDVSTVIEERGLSMWSGARSDFGLGITLSSGTWDVRAITGMTTLPVDTRQRQTFQQIEIAHPLLSIGSLSITAGGGIRQEWDGSQALLGRVLADVDVGPGRLLGDLVIERSLGSAIRHDAADLVASVGWTRGIGGRFSAGVEGIGRDLEGFWNPAEADGGALLLLGPSLHMQSARRGLTASLTAGPVVQTITPRSERHHFGLFAAATWVPSLHR